MLPIILTLFLATCSTTALSMAVGPSQQETQKEIEQEKIGDDIETAIKNDDVKALQNLISMLINENENENLDKLLFDAVKANSLQIIQFLLKHGADVNSTDDPDGLFSTPLHIAAESKNLETIKLLLEKGADPEIQNLLDKTPLELYPAIKNLLENQKQVEKLGLGLQSIKKTSSN